MEALLESGAEFSPDLCLAQSGPDDRHLLDPVVDEIRRLCAVDDVGPGNDDAEDDDPGDDDAEDDDPGDDDAKDDDSEDVGSRSLVRGKDVRLEAIKRILSRLFARGLDPDGWACQVHA